MLHLKMQRKDYKLNLIKQETKMSNSRERIALNLNAVKSQTVKNVSIELNIVGNLQDDLGKGDTFIVNGRKSLQSVIDGYSSAIVVYNGIIPTANKYLDMAKALGEATIQKQLETIIKNANEMIKLSNQAINKLKSI